MTPQRFRLGLGAIALAGFAVRVVYTLAWAPWPPVGFSDQVFYREVPLLVAQGKGFIDPIQALLHHHVASVGHPPFYVVVLAGVAKVFGAGDDPRRLAGSVFGVVVIVCVALIARRLAGPRAGLIAAAIAAIYPMLITADGALMSESLYGMLIALALLTAYHLLDAPATWTAIAFGALVGLAALTHGDGFILAPLVLVPVFRRPGGRRATLIGCAALVVVLIPWTVRNAVVFHKFIPVSTNTTVAGANCHSTYYGSLIGGWDIRCIKPYPGNEAVAMARATSDATHYAEHHLTRLPIVALARLERTWISKPHDLSNLEGRNGHAVELGYAMYYVLVALSIYAVVLLRRRGVGLWLILSPIVLVTITTVLTYGGARFREPAELSLVVLGAVGVDALWQRADARLRHVRPGAVA